MKYRHVFQKILMVATGKWQFPKETSICVGSTPTPRPSNQSPPGWCLTFFRVGNPNQSHRGWSWMPQSQRMPFRNGRLIGWAFHDIVKTNHVYQLFFLNIKVALDWSRLHHLSRVPPIFLKQQRHKPTSCVVWIHHSCHRIIFDRSNSFPQEIVPFGSITTTGPTTNLTGQKVCVVQKNPQGHVLTRPGFLDSWILGKRWAKCLCKAPLEKEWFRPLQKGLV